MLPARTPPIKSLNRTFRRFDPSSNSPLLSEETEYDEENAGLTGRNDPPGHVRRVRVMLPDHRVVPVLSVEPPGAVPAGTRLLPTRAICRAIDRGDMSAALCAGVPAGRSANDAAIHDAGPDLVCSGCAVQHLPAADDGAPSHVRSARLLCRARLWIR
jgi:hypothetical protein